MSKQKVISVIVVVRNEVKTIVKTLKNIIDQDFKDFELIISDDLEGLTVTTPEKQS